VREDNLEKPLFCKEILYQISLGDLGGFREVSEVELTIELD
jgi:hypothetical protein